MNKTLKILALADLHIGNPRLDPHHFQACIEEYVLPRITSELSHVIICGDFFDLLINMNSIASQVAMTVIGLLKRACYENGVKLRVLRGTFTHDRNQPKHFLISSPEYNKNVALFDTLSIEYDEETGTNFLYIPDNLPYSDIYNEVEKLLEAHSLKTVDVVVHHGYFKHMLPLGIPEPNGTLDYEKFKKYYTGCVLNGHVHIPSIHHNVLSIGSFDRLAYGEEEPKGYSIVTRKENNEYSYEFVENKSANLFITADFKEFNGNIEAAYGWFESHWIPIFKEYNRPARVRILTDDSGLVEGLKSVLADQLPDIRLERLATTKREQLIENVQLDLESLVEITEQNLGELVVPLIQQKYPKITTEEILGVLETLKKK